MIKIKKDKLLIKPSRLKPTSKIFEVLGVLNPAAVRLDNGKIILYIRVIERLRKIRDKEYYYSPRYVGENNFKIKIDKFHESIVSSGDDFGFEFKDGTKRLTFISHFRRVLIDKKGFRVLSIDKSPSFFGTIKDSELGVEDPRIVHLEGKYYMTYVGLSRNNSIATNLAVSDDCYKWKRLGIIFGQQDKDVVLFPERIKNKYVAFDRPEGNFQFSTPHIWIADSSDLLNWGDLKSLKIFRSGEHFDRSGAGPPPIKIKEGWLFLFHAVTKSAPEGIANKFKKYLGMSFQDGHDIYSVWSALIDKDNPKKIVRRSNGPIVIPQKKYEISFEGKKVVFPTGLVMDKSKKDVLVYSGAGDEFITVKKINLKSILKSMKKF